MKLKLNFINIPNKIIEVYSVHHEAWAEKWIINDMLTSLHLKLFMRKGNVSDVRKESDIL
jgi:hypothetical protein